MDFKDTLLIGDQTTLTFKTMVPKGAKYVFPAPENPVMQGVEIVGAPQIDTISNVGGQLNLETKVVLTSFDSGSYQLPKFKAFLEKQDGTVDTLWYDGGQINYTTIQIDTTSFKPYDVKGQMTYPYTFREFLPLIVIVALLVLTVYFLVRLIRRRKKTGSLFTKPAIPDPPYVVALRELENIKNSKMWQNNQEKLFYTKITDVLRVYIEKRFGIATLEKTSAEILQALSKEKIDDPVFADLKDLFTLSDFVKFAKYKATLSDNENAVPYAVRFVNATVPAQVNENEVKETKEQDKGEVK